ncbi:putative transcription factor [Glycine max]|uniref:probable transcription factor At5g28040 n=1 Tax=Glycine max TaxID=3847 RepID=UPI001B3564CD|nr:probable transcription factor At5g28040 [Glycine max]KAH1229762.1 putative transcription factor [Glycine max]
MSVSTFVGFEFPSFESAHPEMLGRWGRVERWDRVVGDCVVEIRGTEGGEAVYKGVVEGSENHQMHNCHKRTNGYLDTLICEKRKCDISSTMLSRLVSWILSPSSSEEEEEILDIIKDNDINHENDQKFNVEDDKNDHFLNSCDVDDTIPIALAVPNASPAVTVAFPANDERNTVPTTATVATIVTRSKGQRNAKYSGMVRQYQRLWTKEDEMELLKGYLDYVKQHRKETTTLQNVVVSLYDHVRPKLNIDFNRNQLVEKLRRLKRKHKLALEKGKDKEVPFRNPQEQAIFEISHKIWANDTDNIIVQDALDGDESGHTPESHDHVGNVKVKIEQVDNSDEIGNRVPKRLRLDDADDMNRTNDQNNGDSIQGFIEDTMRSCFSPLLKEVLDEAQEESLPELEAIPMPLCSGEVDHEQWRKRRILELEVYVKRLELLQNQIKSRLEELRSS